VNVAGERLCGNAGCNHTEPLETGVEIVTLPADDWRRAVSALEAIHAEGKVCAGYETCEHESCRSSYTAWAIADAYLRGGSNAMPSDFERAGAPPGLVAAAVYKLQNDIGAAWAEAGDWRESAWAAERQLEGALDDLRVAIEALKHYAHGPYVDADSGLVARDAPARLATTQGRSPG
jgi:hypothetical protein